MKVPYLITLLSSFIVTAQCISPHGHGHSHEHIARLQAEHRRAASAADEAGTSHHPRSPSEQTHFNLARNMSIMSPHRLLPSSMNIMAADDYTCGPDRPCRNGACCGASGNCGYGPAYCEDGCMSNCDAKAECGRFAAEPGQKCPLNVCCSQHGFCGTTSEFCDSTCQSNCLEHPTPPGGSSKGKVLDRVIGYYEAWSDRSKCHQTSPRNLPLNALTHVNYAFAYIDPKGFQISTMDGATPASLFSDLAKLKEDHPQLQLFISVGGWTFSDNFTDTQPVFGNIARDGNNRQLFADNLLRFLDTYGFDGVDLDWEYPGAPDRGGKPDDVQNFPKLLQTIRQTFDRSGRKLGITFTVPSSYWYLKWFDMPALLKYADWTNLMSYDLHGIWDSNNPIGNQVLGHTNLTEIKLAAELLWRVGVKPNQVALGFGFYGRAFRLQDPSCTEPGCPFSGGADPGICTATSGYLAYYEVKDILERNSGIQVKHDRDAAVKYFSWDGQWISYDDADTFKQKVEWANDIGFSGSLIWASDLDDYTFSAHSALLGQDLYRDPLTMTGALAPSMAWELDQMDGETGKTCYRNSACTILNEGNVSPCDPGYITVGWDHESCGMSGDKRMGKRICCEKTKAPNYCVWRGYLDGSSNCNGICQTGEMTLFKSNVGGLSTIGNKIDEDTDMKGCRQGSKAFCCKAPDYSDMGDLCKWRGCGELCASFEWEVATAIAVDDVTPNCPSDRKHKYCCIGAAKPFTECHWMGEADCGENNSCTDTQVTVAQSFNGDGRTCQWGRKQSLCCTPNLEFMASKHPFLCYKKTWCDYDPASCSSGLTYDSDDDTDKDSIVGGSIVRRAGMSRKPDIILKIVATDPFAWVQPTYRTASGLVTWYNKNSPTNFPPSYVVEKTGVCGLQPVSTNMLWSVVQRLSVPATANLPGDDQLQADHAVDTQLLGYFANFAVTGVTNYGQKLNVPTVSWEDLKRMLSEKAKDPITDVLTGFTPKNNPQVGGERIMAAAGNAKDPTTFSLVARSINGPKGKMFEGTGVVGSDVLDTANQLWKTGDPAKMEEALTIWMKALNTIYNLNTLLNDPAFLANYGRVMLNLADEIQRASVHYAGLQNLPLLWDTFMKHTLEYQGGRVNDLAQGIYQTVNALMAGAKHIDPTLLMGLTNSMKGLRGKQFSTKSMQGKIQPRALRRSDPSEPTEEARVEQDQDYTISRVDILEES